MSMRFDDLAKAIARGESRRGVLRKFGAALFGAAVVSGLPEGLVASASELDASIRVNGVVFVDGGAVQEEIDQTAIDILLELHERCDAS